MFIDPMQGISGVTRGANSFFETPAAPQKTNAFKDIFATAIQEVKTNEEDLAKAQYLLATGQIDDPHTVTIASTNAQTSVDLLVGLRNKALEAYNELMRMNI